MDDRLMISVEDEGEGISPAKMASAFDPFYSGKTAGRRTGMGLAKARRLIDRHGGKLVLENLEDGGLAARIFLSEWQLTRGEQSPERDKAA